MDLGPVDRITADAIGEPGARVFYIQARAGVELVTVIVEKQQVQLLAASVLELLEDVPSAELEAELGAGSAGSPAPEGPAMALEEPIDPREPAASRSASTRSATSSSWRLRSSGRTPKTWTKTIRSPLGSEAGRIRSRSASGRRRPRCWRSRGMEQRSPRRAGPRASSAATRSTRRATRVPR